MKKKFDDLLVSIDADQLLIFQQFIKQAKQNIIQFMLLYTPNVYQQVLQQFEKIETTIAQKLIYPNITTINEADI